MLPRLLLALSFVALVFTCTCLAEAPAQTPGETLRVMSFNVRNSGAKDGPDAWKFRKARFADTVHTFGPDLLGTQEVLADQFDDLHAMFPEFTALGVARDDGARKGEWSAILYRTDRFEQLAVGNFWLSETPDTVGSRSWDAACVRICTWARLRDKKTGVAFLIANPHFDHRSELARVRSAELMSERLPQLSQGGPVIITGDFNCTEDDAAYASFTRPTAAGRVTLTDSFREAHPTRSPQEASFNGFKGTVQGSRIDWILHTPQMQTLTAEIVRPAEPPYPSDHYPVTATFRWLP